jgi:hypothetical protein
VKQKQTENTRNKKIPPKKRETEKKKSEFKNCAEKLPDSSGLKTSC